MLMLSFMISGASAYVEEHDGLYDIYYHDKQPEVGITWTLPIQPTMGYAVKHTAPFAPCELLSITLFIEAIQDFYIVIYNETRGEIFRMYIHPLKGGWRTYNLTTPVRIEDETFYVALIYTTHGHLKIGLDTSGYQNRSYVIIGEEWRPYDEVAQEEGWAYLGEFCITSTITMVDSDGDGLYDHEEVQLGTNYNNPDTDGDGLNDKEEIETFTTDPTKADTDEDGIDDGEEVAQGLDPKNPDMDDDGLLDGEELALGLDLRNPDSDGDGLSDGDEVNVYGIDPKVADTDNDGLSDSEEVNIGTDPTKVDTDGDRIDDATEIGTGTDPKKIDTDGDGLSDSSDPMPTNALLPNGLAIIGIAAIAAAALYLHKRKKQ